ncbi:hypothetical protein LTR17_006346 [Elasticomyces elasticus]|nr:hypothetical protein LTR17_006346 [Elasticomyces elasticus]
MAAQVTIDLANVGEQIASAVKEAVEQATNKLLAANLENIKDANKLLAANLKKIKDANKQDSGFDIRGQILANAHWLWKVARCYDAEEQDPKGEPGPPSLPVPLTVIVNNVGSVFVAEVRLQQARDNRHIHQAAFLESENTSSVNEALRKLLRTTTELMGGEELDGQHTWRAGLGKEGYVAVESGTMQFATGECDECDEFVWP